MGRDKKKSTKNNEYKYYDAQRERIVIYHKLVFWIVLIVWIGAIVCLFPYWNIFGSNGSSDSDSNSWTGEWTNIIEVLAGLIGIVLGFWIDRRYVEQLRMLQQYKAYRCVLEKDIEYLRQQAKQDIIDVGAKKYGLFGISEDSVSTCRGEKKQLSIRGLGYYLMDERYYGTKLFWAFEILCENIVKYYNENEVEKDIMGVLWDSFLSAKGTKFIDNFNLLEKWEKKGSPTIKEKIEFLRDTRSFVMFILQNSFQFSISPLHVDTFDDILNSASSMSLFFNLPRKNKKDGKKQNERLGNLLRNIDKNIKYINFFSKQKEENKSGLNVCIIYEYKMLRQNLKNLCIIMGIKTEG